MQPNRYKDHIEKKHAEDVTAANGEASSSVAANGGGTGGEATKCGPTTTAEVMPITYLSQMTALLKSIVQAVRERQYCGPIKW